MRKSEHLKRTDGQAGEVERLIESKCLGTTIKHKKWLKNHLNRTFRRKNKRKVYIDNETC